MLSSTVRLYLGLLWHVPEGKREPWHECQISFVGAFKTTSRPRNTVYRTNRPRNTAVLLLKAALPEKKRLSGRVFLLQELHEPLKAIHINVKDIFLESTVTQNGKTGTKNIKSCRN